MAAMNVKIFGSVLKGVVVGTGVSVPAGSGGAVRVSVTGRTSIVGNGPTGTRPGAVVGVAEFGGVCGSGATRGAVDGGSGMNTRVVLVLAIVVGAAVVGGGTVVGAAAPGDVVVGGVGVAVVGGTPARIGEGGGRVALAGGGAMTEPGAGITRPSGGTTSG